jgi:hypothetical protein
MTYELDGDIVTKLREAACPPNTGCMSVKICVCDIMGDAADEIERLNRALKWEQDRSGRVGTHSPGCWTWGHQHYQCAIQHIAALDKEIESAALIVAEIRKDTSDARLEIKEMNRRIDLLRGRKS